MPQSLPLYMPHCNLDFWFYNLVMSRNNGCGNQHYATKPGLRNISLNVNYSLHVHSGILLPQKKETCRAALH